jgi:hypothetical protein
MEHKCWKERGIKHTQLDRWTCASGKWMIPRHQWSPRCRIAHGWKILVWICHQGTWELMKQKELRIIFSFLLLFCFLLIFLLFFFSFFFLVSLFFSSHHNLFFIFHSFFVLLLRTCWRIKLVTTYDLQAYGPTPFSPRDSQGSCQSAEQGDC